MQIPEQSREKMTQRSFFGLIGALAVSLDWLLFHIYHWIQVSWEERLRLSANLPRWWLITGLLLFLGYSAIMALFLMLARRYRNIRLIPVAASVPIDTVMTIIFWILSTVFDDPLLKNQLVAVGLGYLPTLFFWGGALWLLVGFARVGLFSPYTSKAMEGRP
jgi:hypothetical protein